MRVPLACAFLMGAVGGSRSMLAPAAVSRAARNGMLRVKGTPLAFLGGRNAKVLFMVLASAELVADTLPMTPSRKAAVGFTARVLSGALVGAAVGASADQERLGALLGVAGAVVGKECSAAFRSWLASLFDRDLPAAIIEDLVAFALIGYVSSKLSACAAPDASAA